METTSIEGSVSKKLHEFDNLLSSDTLITGGHFMLKNNQPILNEGTIQSFKSAVSLYKTGKENGLKVGLGLLVNDIGMTCDTNLCYVVDSFDRKNFQLPDQYTQILKQEGVDVFELDLFWEKHLRNVGMKMFKSKMLRKDPSVKKIDNAYWLITENKDRLLLTRFSPASPNGIPACPLIVGANTVEQNKRGWKKSINFWYVDIDNYDNIPNYFVIEKGLEVARRMGVAVDVKNVCFTHDKVFTNF